MTPELNQPQSEADLTPTPAAESTRPSPGAVIRRARELAHLTQEDLAAQLKLARATLDALERDDFNVLVEPVYVRGYYRKCAKLLGISEQELVDAYQSRVAPRAPAAPSKLRLASGTELGSGSRLPVALSLLAAVVAVVVCAFIWFARGETNRVPAAVAAKVEAMTPEGDKAAAPAPADNTPATGAAEPADAAAASASAAATPDLPTSSVPAAVPATAPTATPAPTAVAPAAPPAVPAAPAAAAAASSEKPAAPAEKPATATTAPAASTPTAASLGLNFSVTSWARIDDANGKTLLNGLVRAGDKPAIKGIAPFKLFLGNATGVTLELNGKPVDLSQYTADNKTARFTLAP